MFDSGDLIATRKKSVKENCPIYSGDLWNRFSERLFRFERCLNGDFDTHFVCVKQCSDNFLDYVEKCRYKLLSHVFLVRFYQIFRLLTVQ